MNQYPTQNLVTVSGFKSRNPEIDTTAWDDTTISGFISRATRAVQNFCNVDGFLKTTVSGERSKAIITAEGDLVVYPRIRPLTTSGITAVRLVKGGFSTTLTIRAQDGTPYFQVPWPSTNFVFPGTYLAGSGTLLGGASSHLVTLQGSGLFAELDYTAGFDQAPEDLQDACELFVRDYLTRRLNPTGAQDVRQGSFSISRATRSSNPNADMVNSVYVQQAMETLSNGGYVRTAMG